VKLDIGAGDYRRGEEYTTLDAYHAEADIKAFMWEIPLPDKSVEEIWCAHALEHVGCAKVAPTLKEFRRVLKPWGRAIIQVPNFDYVAKYWLTGPDRNWAERMIFGMQTNEGEFLKADLEACGFTVERVEMRWTHNQETLQAVARRPRKDAPCLADTPSDNPPSATGTPVHQK
jgi:cyclopropane fatty-acyl-phospholipid synthase-like methyltransferase